MAAWSHLYSSFTSLPQRCLILASLLAGVSCESLPLRQTGALQSYAGLERSDGLATQALVRADAAGLKVARSIRVLPTAFALGARGANSALTERQWRLVGNAVNRSLCIGLSDRFTLVNGDKPADLTVRVIVTDLRTTNEVTAGISKGATIIPALLQVPVPVPRLPVGLGGLSAEAEARDSAGGQVAAMVWSRQAQIIGSSATVSKIGDAYSLADELGQDFSRLVSEGKSPFGQLPSFPSSGRAGAALGLDPDQSACRDFGAGPGLGGALGSAVGLPPEWTDDGPPGGR